MLSITNDTNATFYSADLPTFTDRRINRVQSLEAAKSIATPNDWVQIGDETKRVQFHISSLESIQQLDYPLSIGNGSHLVTRQTKFLVMDTLCYRE
jgi:hypothetical protein